MVDQDYLSETVSLLRSCYQDLDWPDLDEVVGLFLDTETIDWWLPIAASTALERDPDLALPASGAVLASQAAIILVDDILDEDPKGVHRRIGIGRASNLAMALESLAFDCLATASISSAHRLGATKALCRMFTVTAFGQSADSSEIQSEAQYWEMIRNKSTPFYGLALQLGAYMAEASETLVDGFHELGVLVGEIVQLHDDLYDALDSPAKPDWSQRSNNLLILYGSTVDHEDRNEFLAGLPNAADPQVLEMLHRILIRSGALSYCAYQLVLRYKRCLELARGLELPNPSPILQLVSEQVRPVKAILEEVSADIPPEFAGYD